MGDVISSDGTFQMHTLSAECLYSAVVQVVVKLLTVQSTLTVKQTPQNGAWQHAVIQFFFTVLQTNHNCIRFFSVYMNARQT